MWGDLERTSTSGRFINGCWGRPAWVSWSSILTDCHITSHNSSPVPVERAVTARRRVHRGLAVGAWDAECAFSYGQRLRWGARPAHCVDVIESRIRESAYRLRDIQGVRLAGPQTWELSSGINSIQFPGRSPWQIKGLANSLREVRRNFIKYRPEKRTVYVATAPFNTAEEADLLLESLAQLVPEM